MNRAKPPYDTKKDSEFHRRYQEYNMVYNTPEGKRVLDDIMYYAAIDRTAFCMKSESQTMFNLGKQSIGYHVFNSLNEPFTLPQPINKGEDN